MKIGTVFEGTPISTCKSHILIGGYIITYICMQISQSYERIRKTRGGNTATPSRHHGKNHINHARSMLCWYPKLVTQDLANAPIFPCPSARAMEAVWYRNHSSNLLTHLRIDPKTKALGGSHENWCTLDTLRLGILGFFQAILAHPIDGLWDKLQRLSREPGFHRIVL